LSKRILQQGATTFFYMGLMFLRDGGMMKSNTMNPERAKESCFVLAEVLNGKRRSDHPVVRRWDEHAIRPLGPRRSEEGGRRWSRVRGGRYPEQLISQLFCGVFVSA
jgi:hypothetical protein